MDGRYTFTRAWGSVCAGLGWLLLVGNPVVATVLAVAIQAQTPPRGPYAALLVPGMILAGILVGLVVGGAFIVAGQRLRIAVDSFHVQLAMLERLDEISAILAHRAETQGGRFRPLAGECQDAPAGHRQDRGRAARLGRGVEGPGSQRDAGRVSGAQEAAAPGDGAHPMIAQEGGSRAGRRHDG
jgi:hypothetical protein